MNYQECLKTKEKLKEKIVEKIQNILYIRLATAEYNFHRNKVHFKVSFNLNNEAELSFFLFKRNDTLDKDEFGKYYLKYNIISNRFSIDVDMTKEGFHEENYVILAFYKSILSIDNLLDIIQMNN